MPPEHSGIGALTGITTLQSHLHNRFTGGQALQRPQQTSKLTPLSKADASMATKQALESFDTHGQLLGPGTCISIIGAGPQMTTHPKQAQLFEPRQMKQQYKQFRSRQGHRCAAPASGPPRAPAQPARDVHPKT